MNSPEKDLWQKAMEEEYKQHELNHKWDPLSTLPAGNLFIPSHMVLFKKRSANGSINK